MEGICGPHPTMDGARRFISLCQLQPWKCLRPYDSELNAVTSSKNQEDLLKHFLHALIHPDRSVPGFPTSLHWTWPRVRFSVGEGRIKCTNAAKFGRKSGGA